MYHRILIAIDKSEITQYILEKGIFLAKLTNTEIMLLHVISIAEDPAFSPVFLQPDTIYPSLQTELIDEYLQEWQVRKQERLDWLRSLNDQAKNIGIKSSFTQSLGDAGRIICEVARTWPADLIIIGRRGHVGLSEFFLGSVSNYVLHHAPCSVLVIQGSVNSRTQSP